MEKKNNNLRNQFVDDSKKKLRLYYITPTDFFFFLCSCFNRKRPTCLLHYQLCIKLKKEKKTNKRKEPTKLGLSPFVWFLVYIFFFFHLMDFLSFYIRKDKKKQDEDTIIRSSNCFVCIVTFFYIA